MGSSGPGGASPPSDFHSPRLSSPAGAANAFSSASSTCRTSCHWSELAFTVARSRASGAVNASPIGSSKTPTQAHVRPSHAEDEGLPLAALLRDDGQVAADREELVALVARDGAHDEPRGVPSRSQLDDVALLAFHDGRDHLSGPPQCDERVGREAGDDVRRALADDRRTPRRRIGEHDRPSAPLPQHVELLLREVELHRARSGDEAARAVVLPRVEHGAVGLRVGGLPADDPRLDEPDLGLRAAAIEERRTVRGAVAVLDREGDGGEGEASVPEALPVSARRPRVEEERADVVGQVVVTPIPRGTGVSDER